MAVCAAAPPRVAALRSDERTSEPHPDVASASGEHTRPPPPETRPRAFPVRLERGVCVRTGFRAPLVVDPFLSRPLGGVWSRAVCERENGATAANDAKRRRQQDD